MGKRDLQEDASRFFRNIFTKERSPASGDQLKVIQHFPHFFLIRGGGSNFFFVGKHGSTILFTYYTYTLQYISHWYTRKPGYPYEF